MRTEKNWRLTGLGLIVLTLSAALAACGGSSDASSSGSTAAASSGTSAAEASPTVSGTPTKMVVADNRYSFTPTVTNPNGTPLTFSIQNKPAWATFAVTTGGLSGTPSVPDAGSYSNIVISATDGTNTSALPAFSIQVTAAATSTSSGSSSGAASTSSSSSGGTSTSSSSSSSSGGSTGSSGSGTASVSAQALLNYLTGLASDSRHILTGQHSSYWDSNPMDNISALYSQTGTNPAILGTTVGQSGSTEDVVGLSNSWLAQGGIAMVSLWPTDPVTGADDNDRSISVSDIYTPGTAANAAWNTYLDGIAAKLKGINGPFLFRPFVELNGNWSWWGGLPTAQFTALWQYTWTRLVQTDGVTNALWVYNVNAWSGNYTAYYPGSAYVDIVSWDSYPPSASDAPWYNALVGLGKPIILAETGASSNASSVEPYTYNNDDILGVVKANFPKVVAVVVWCQNLSLSEQQGDEAFMTDSAVISLADLPAGI
jgi:hypothetical protein